MEEYSVYSAFLLPYRQSGGVAMRQLCNAGLYMQHQTFMRHDESDWEGRVTGSTNECNILK